MRRAFSARDEVSAMAGLVEYLKEN